MDLQTKTRYNKVELLETYWNRTYEFVKEKALKMNDKHTTTLLIKIMEIPAEVKKELLLQYIKSCREVYAIAFFQWRYRYPSTMPRSKEDLSVLNNERIDHLASLFKKRQRLQADGSKSNGLYRHFL